MLRCTILCMDFAMNAPQAPDAPPARRPDGTQPAAAPDAQPGLLPGDAAEAQAATPEPAPPQTPGVTVEDMSGWAMGGSSVSD